MGAEEKAVSLFLRVSQTLRTKLRKLYKSSDAKSINDLCITLLEEAIDRHTTAPDELIPVTAHEANLVKAVLYLSRFLSRTDLPRRSSHGGEEGMVKLLVGDPRQEIQGSILYTYENLLRNTARPANGSAQP